MRRLSPSLRGFPWGSGKSRAILRLMTMFGLPMSSRVKNRPSPFSLRARGKTALLRFMWDAMYWPEITGWSKTDDTPLGDNKPLSMPRPSILGAMPQTSGATARTPGSRLRSSARLAGRVLKTGLGTFCRMTITPSIRLRVSPTRSRSPLETLNRPITPRMGTDSPIRASTVRSGRVSRLRQAKTPMFKAPRARSVHDDRSVGHCALPLPATAGKYRPDHHRPGKWNPQDAAGSKREGPAGSRHAGEPVAKLDPWRGSPAAPCPRAVRSYDHATYCVSFSPELGSADGADSGWACSGWEESPGGIATSDGSP